MNELEKFRLTWQLSGMMQTSFLKNNTPGGKTYSDEFRRIPSPFSNKTFQNDMRKKI
jgi:hypothetical protein